MSREGDGEEFHQRKRARINLNYSDGSRKMELANLGAQLCQTIKENDSEAVTKMLENLPNHLVGYKNELLEYRDELGFTPLMYATRNERFGICKLLVANGVDPNAVNEKGSSALVFAAQRGNAEIAQLLLSAGSSVLTANAALIPAAHFGHEALVKLLLKSGASANFVNHKGTTALMRASQEGKIAVVTLLLQAGALPNSSNGEGMTALMLAAQRGHHNIVSGLLRAGAEVNMHTRQGSTALLLAAKRGHIKCVKVLVSIGADISRQDERSKTAYESAERRGYHYLLKYLTVDGQICLMRQAARTERSHQLVQLSILYLRKDASIKTESCSSEESSLMHKLLVLPMPLLQIVLKFIPMPPLWDKQLNCLVSRCGTEPNEVVRDGIKILDEVLFHCAMEVHQPAMKLAVERPKSKKGLLMQLSQSPSFAFQFRASMDLELFDRLKSISSIQSVIENFGEANMEFKSPIGHRVIAVLRDLLEWNTIRQKHLCP